MSLSAPDRQYARLVHSPSEKAIAFYERAGFIWADQIADADGLLVRPRETWKLSGSSRAGTRWPGRSVARRVLGNRDAGVDAGPSLIEGPDRVGVNEIADNQREYVWEAHRAVLGFERCERRQR